MTKNELQVKYGSLKEIIRQCIRRMVVNRVGGDKGKSGGGRINFHGIIRSIDNFRFVFVTVSAFIDLRISMKKEKERIKATVTNQIIVIN